MLCNMINQSTIVCAAISPNAHGFKEVLGHGKYLRNMNCMDELIWAEGEDSEDHPKWPHPAHHVKWKAKAKPTTAENVNLFSSHSVEDVSDADDINFSEESHSKSSSETSATSSDNDIEEITNEEVCHFL